MDLRTAPARTAPELLCGRNLASMCLEYAMSKAHQGTHNLARMKQRFTLFLLFSTLALVQQKPAAELDPHVAHMQRIEQNVAAITLGRGEQPRQYSLLELMKVLDGPGVSVAVPIRSGS